ncbi:protein FLX-like 1 isoform X2 [Malania oleifera]|uniref:protein FLX-like 1 isoform X2 n=1 Tax=Malania oleifera TaxID=397392 RepID=UPI0025AEBD90|nr:protein FLX-like 1 isoform X2 [Malania oleifera]
MSARNRGPPVPLMSASHAGLLPIREPPYGRSLAPVPHPSLLDDARNPHIARGAVPGPGPLLPGPPAAAIIEDRLAAQHHEIQALLVDNQRLAATHVALKQELELSQHEIRRMANVLGSVRAEADLQLKEEYEKLRKMEADLHAVHAMKAELMQVRADVQQLSGARQELTGRVQAMTEDLDGTGVELQKLPALKGEIEGMKQELRRARAAIEYEKKGYAENYEHGQAMERNLIAMAREMEKLRAELANAEKRARAAAAVGNLGAGYGGSYGDTEMSYGRHPYSAGYSMNAGGAGGIAQYGPGPASARAPPTSWGTYDMQRAHGGR